MRYCLNDIILTMVSCPKHIPSACSRNSPPGQRSSFHRFLTEAILRLDLTLSVSEGVMTDDDTRFELTKTLLSRRADLRKIS